MLSSKLAGMIKSGTELLRSMEERRRRSPLKTGSPLNRLEGGGLRRGSLIELSGPRSSGRFAVALSAVAAATRAGEAAALIDLGDHLDPRTAEEAGVVLERLLWMRPRSIKEALVCALHALSAGFALVVLDLGERRAEPAAAASWLRLARAAQAAQSIMLLVSPRPTAGAAAEAVLEAENGRALWDKDGPPLLKGVAADWRLRDRHMPLWSRGRGRHDAPSLPG